MKWVVPKYCDALFYTGWHLYLCLTPGMPTRRDDYVWLRDAIPLDDLRRVLNHADAPEIPHDRPSMRAGRAFVDWFAGAYPDGLHVVVEGRRIVGLA